MVIRCMAGVVAAKKVGLNRDPHGWKYGRPIMDTKDFLFLITPLPQILQEPSYSCDWRAGDVTERVVKGMPANQRPRR